MNMIDVFNGLQDFFKNIKHDWVVVDTWKTDHHIYQLQKCSKCWKERIKRF